MHRMGPIGSSETRIFFCGQSTILLYTIRLHSTESYHIRNSSRVPGWIVSRFPFQHSSTTHPSLSTIFISEQFSIESRLDVAIDMSDYPTDVVGFLRFHVD